MNGLGTRGDEADGVLGADAAQPGEAPPTPTEPEEPAGWVNLSFEHPRPDAVDRFSKLFAANGIPAVFWCTGLGDWVTLEARVIYGRDGDLLRWAGMPGAEWAPLAPDIVEGIAGALGVPLTIGEVEVSPPEHAWPKRLEERRLVDAMVIVARDSSITADLLAREAKAPVVVNRFDKWVVISPLGDPGAVESSNVWGMPDAIVLWRQGDERGTSTVWRNEKDGHTWGLEIGFVDPSNPWHRDGSGRTVAEWLEMTRPEPTDWKPWAAVARLSGDEAERLRVELRREVSDERTFARFSEALGLPQVVADLLETDLDPLLLPGAEVVRPAGALKGVWHAVRRDVRDAEEPVKPAEVEAPTLPRWTLWWPRLTAKRPWWYHILALGMIGLFAWLSIVRLQDAAGNAWVPILGLILWVADYAVPRRAIRALREDPADRADGDPDGA
jgi:hypothetical protein